MTTPKSPDNPEETFARFVRENPFTAAHCGADWALRQINDLRRLLEAAAKRIGQQSELLSRKAERTNEP